MEFCSILQFLENKSILVAGATGFVAKVFVEKILRVQPELKKLYLLLRAENSLSAFQRFNTEIIAKELFVVLKEKYGANFNSFIEEKVTLLAGDVTYENLGLNDSILGELYEEVDVVVNLAATTDFDARYDFELGINTMGPANVLEFSKKCNKLRVLLHVSTAYVCGEKDGIVLETPFNMGETLNGTSGLDINEEKEIVQETLKELHADENASQKYIDSIMKDLGIQRARKYGWPNTYSFTKAMGEMLLGHLKERIPLVIIRPTIITSTFKEPFPGWLEGVRNIDSFLVGYGKGNLTCTPGNPQGVTDLIPVDMVVNAMIVAMVANANEPSQTIYHVGSSTSNPVNYGRLQEYGLKFFTEKPWINKEGKIVTVRKATELGTKETVRWYMLMHYLIPLKVLWLVNIASCKLLFQGMYADLSRKVKFLMRIVELFSPYIFFNGIFDDTNTDKLRKVVGERCWVEKEMFYFDPKSIDWGDYFMYTHIAGVVKYTFKK